MIRRARIKQLSAFLCCLALLLAMLLPFSARADQNIVRVLLTRLSLTDQITVSLDGSYTVGDLSFQRGSKLVFSCASGRLMLYYEGMAYDVGASARLVRHAAADGKENGLRINGGYALYCGDLQINVDGRQLSAVLHIPVEEYLLGVVPYEMSDSFPLEALKAQAVAARTYALRKASGSGAYDVVDNTNDQVYRGYQKENEQAARAVAETAGVCAYEKNALANCYYTASNGGQIELPQNVWGKSEGSFITMHEDPYDVENPESVVKKAVIAKAPADGVIGNAALTEAVKLLLSEPLMAKGYTGEAEDIRITHVNSLELHAPIGGRQSLVMSSLRMEVSVEARRTPSQAMMDNEEMSIFQIGQPTAAPQSEEIAVKTPFAAVPQPMVIDVPVFGTLLPLLGLTINGTNNEIVTVTESDAAFEICARRYGHGVGMSQRGAQWMAGQYGWSYEQILRFYYPGLTLKQIDTQVTLPPALSAEYLTTPGPAATPTPRPTLMPATQALAAGEYRVKVTQIGVNSSLNLRSAPSTDADILRVLYYGQELIVTKRLPDGWLQVKTDVLEGFVMEKFVENME